MNLKNAFIRGTLLLTFAGLISRFMGFFYRIFLANTIGAEGMGIYQLIFPIYSVCFSLCASGIETAVSKLTAEKITLGKPDEAFSILKTGLCMTLLLSISCSLIVFHYADLFAEIFLKEPRCTGLLKLLAMVIPFGAAHACICGYYFGIHKAGVPSISQLLEQSFRMLSVFLLYKLSIANEQAVSPAIAVSGLIFGEFFSLLFTITCFSFSRKNGFYLPVAGFLSHFKEIFTFAAPLTASRICINLLASLEATLIPNALKAFGMNHTAALSTYGILTGMALPFIFFPNTLTGSVSLMLLPKVSESKAGGQLEHLKHTIRKTFLFCIALGGVCLIFFLFFGNFLGEFLFSNALAGRFITVLAWICPFLYLNTTLNSVLNGLSLANVTFMNGICGLLIRIGFTFFVVPKSGIQGYLFGLLASQFFVTFLGIISLKKYFLNEH